MRLAEVLTELRRDAGQLLEMVCSQYWRCLGRFGSCFFISLLGLELGQCHLSLEGIPDLPSVPLNLLPVLLDQAVIFLSLKAMENPSPST